jgi:hypothetical protein
MVETETKLGDYSTPQNNLDRMLLEKFPDVPLSIMRDIYLIHKDFSEEQQNDFLNATTSGKWEEYDKKYNINNIRYNTFDEVIEDMNKNEVLEEIEE